MDYKPPNSKFFTDNELTPPVTTPHGTEEDIRENLKPLKTWNWRQEGNLLTADTDHGILTQTIPVDYICIGTDPHGKPLLKKIVL